MTRDRYLHQVRVLILGSCVTRDAFERLPDGSPLTVAEYFARSLLASAMHPAEFTGVELERIESPFQRRMVAWDLTGAFMGALTGRVAWDVIVYDPIDERFDMYEQPAGGRATRSSEFLRAGYDAGDDRSVRTGGAEAFDLWEGGWSALVDRLRALGRLGDLRVNRVSWATEVDGGGALPAVYTPAVVGSANAYLERLYARAAVDLEDSQFYAYEPRDLVGAAVHKWGVSPFHYVDSYYARLIDALTRDAVARSPG